MGNRYVQLLLVYMFSKQNNSQNEYFKVFLLLAKFLVIFGKKNKNKDQNWNCQKQLVLRGNLISSEISSQLEDFAWFDSLRQLHKDPLNPLSPPLTHLHQNPIGPLDQDSHMVDQLDYTMGNGSPLSGQFISGYSRMKYPNLYWSDHRHLFINNNKSYCLNQIPSMLQMLYQMHNLQVFSPVLTVILQVQYDYPYFTNKERLRDTEVINI